MQYIHVPVGNILPVGTRALILCPPMHTYYKGHTVVVIGRWEGGRITGVVAKVVFCDEKMGKTLEQGISGIQDDALQATEPLTREEMLTHWHEEVRKLAKT